MPDIEWLMPEVEYSTIACCRVKIGLSHAPATLALMPAQWPGMGEAELEVKVMGLSGVPVALREPLTMSSHLEVSLPLCLSSERAANLTAVPGCMVKVVPEGTTTSPVMLTVPDQTSSVTRVPEEVIEAAAPLVSRGEMDITDASAGGEIGITKLKTRADKSRQNRSFFPFAIIVSH